MSAHKMRGCTCDTCERKRAKNRERARQWRQKNPERRRGCSCEKCEHRRAQVRESVRRWREAHPGKVIEGRRKAYTENPERIRASVKKWRSENPDKVKAWTKAWNEANSDRKREATREWSQTNRDRVHAANARYRARKRKVYVENVDRLMVAKRDNWTCHICGGHIDEGIKHPDPQSLSIDHIVPLIKGGAHTYENCAAAHLGCNARKGARDLH